MSTAAQQIAESWTAFRQHPLLRGGHVQTLAGVFLPGVRCVYKARQHLVDLPDSDQVVLHDDQPAGWRVGDRVVLLIHGLCGCHRSPYVERVAAKLEQRGLRTFRLDLRNCGAGAGLARFPYHSGRSEDAAAALEAIARICPGSPTALIGFSLGGNITLKLLGELGDRPCGNLDRGLAICPPVDLLAAVRNIHRRGNRIYERHFLRELLAQVKRHRDRLPGAEAIDFRRPPKTLWDFDDAYTAPVCGYGDADRYYQQASSLRVAKNIRLPTLVIGAQDDPLVPAEPLQSLGDLSNLRLEMSQQGGHLGFIGRRLDTVGDRRWLDWRIVRWIVEEAEQA